MKNKNSKFGNDASVSNMMNKKGTYPISKDHNAIIRFSANHTPNTLRCGAHRVKGQKLGFFDLMNVAQVLQSRLIKKQEE